VNSLSNPCCSSCSTKGYYGAPDGPTGETQMCTAEQVSLFFFCCFFFLCSAARAAQAAQALAGLCSPSALLLPHFCVLQAQMALGTSSSQPIVGLLQAAAE